MALRSPVAAICVIGAALFCLCLHPAFALTGRVVADGTELVLRLDDGRVLRGRELIGAQLVAATGQGEVRVRIDGIEEDASAVGGPMLLYQFSTLESGQPPAPFCRPDPKGRR